MAEILRLSPHVFPQVRQGIHALVPQNLTAGPKRVLHARACVEMLRHLLGHGDVERARKYRAEMPYAALVTLWEEDPTTGRITVELLPEYENFLEFRPAELGVMFRDGRRRDDADMVYVPTGESTKGFLRLVRRLLHGIDRETLLIEAAELEVGLDDDLLTALIEGQVLEVSDEAPLPMAPDGDGLTWYGHAFASFACAGQRIWVDPWIYPRITWTEDDRASLFTDDVTDAVMLQAYGPDATQWTWRQLPAPTAVFITHQDVDHFDLGTLAMLDPAIPIYVPHYDPTCPWLVDLATVLRTVLGDDRQVHEFHHGTSRQLGAMRVQALPFESEFPASLKTYWNCLLVELPTHAWLVTADAAVTPRTLEAVKRARTTSNPLGLLTNSIVGRAMSAGYTDYEGETVSITRLYSWFVTPIDLYDAVPTCGTPKALLKALVTEVGLTWMYVYARGNLPWYRIGGERLESHIRSDPRAKFETMAKVALAHHVNMLRLHYAEPWQPTAPA